MVLLCLGACRSAFAYPDCAFAAIPDPMLAEDMADAELVALVELSGEVKVLQSPRTRVKVKRVARGQDTRQVGEIRTFKRRRSGKPGERDKMLRLRNKDSTTTRVRVINSSEASFALAAATPPAGCATRGIACDNQHEKKEPATKRETFGAVRHDIQVDGWRGFILEPTAPAPTPVPWIWYCPTFMKGPPSQYDGPKPNREYHDKLVRTILDRGVAVAGVDAGDTLGRPSARKAFSAFYAYVVKHHGLDRRVRFLAESRGGLYAYNWAAENAEVVDRIGAIYPVCNLESYPGLERASRIYDMTPDALRDALADHNPIDRLARLAKHRVRIFHITGDADDLVPHTRNTMVVIQRYRELGGSAEVVIQPGAGHRYDPALFEDERLVRFLCRDDHKAKGRD